MRWTLLSVAFFTLASPELRARPHPKGTHFLAEIGAGYSFDLGFTEGGPGFGIRLAAGAGGRIRGIPLRFYFMAQGSFATSFATLEHGAELQALRRTAVDVNASLRVMLPIRRLRLFVATGFGMSWIGSSATFNGIERYGAKEVGAGLLVQGGAQMRLSRRLSVGLSADWTRPLGKVAPDPVALLAGLTDGGQARARLTTYVTLGVHF